MNYHLPLEHEYFGSSNVTIIFSCNLCQISLYRITLPYVHSRPTFENLNFGVCLFTEAMAMTKTHKDIALFMVQLTEKDNLTERDFMQEISRKTKDLIDHLK